jgi:hypothetical protein
MLYREIIAVFRSTQNTLPELYIKIQSVPRSKLSVTVIQSSQLMLYGEIIAVCSQIHTKHINTLCGQNGEFVNVSWHGTHSYHWPLSDRLNKTFVSKSCDPRKAIRTLGAWAVVYTANILCFEMWPLSGAAFLISRYVKAPSNYHHA